MTCLTATPDTGHVPVLLMLPLPLTVQALRDAEHALATAPAALDPGLSRPQAAEIEYASWMPDPGAVEVASWAAHMRPSVC